MTVDIPSDATAREAEEAVRSLRGVRATQLLVTPEGGAAGIAVTLPSEAFQLLLRILSHMANGDGVTIAPVHAELSTQQAADLLNMSRPHLIKLLEAGALPFHRVGTHRRVRLADLVTFQAAGHTRRKGLLDELTREAQELGLGY